MALNDGTADRKPESHALGLGRDKRIENVVQPLGVDAEVFHPRRRTDTLRERLGLAPAARVLVYAGRFAEEKNLPVLLQAFARLGRPYHLLLIGGAHSGRPADNVTMLPYRGDSAELAGLDPGQ